MPRTTFDAEIAQILRRYFRDLEAVLREEGRSDLFQSLVSELGLGDKRVGADSQLSFPTYLRALEILEHEASIPALGLKLGARKCHGTFGVSGLAILTCATLKQVLEAAQEESDFAWGLLLKFRFDFRGDRLVLSYQAAAAAAGGLRTWIEQAMMTGLRLLMESVPGLDLTVCQARFSYRAPSYVDMYPVFMPFDCVFDQEENEIWIPATWADLPSVFANESVNDFCEAQVESIQLKATGSGRIVRQIQLLLEEAEAPHAHTLGTVAQALRVPERRVRFELHKAGKQFKTMQIMVVMERARRLLANKDLSVKEIAFLLGFSHTASFCRAFSRVQGQTAEHFRKCQFPHEQQSSNCIKH